MSGADVPPDASPRADLETTRPAIAGRPPESLGDGPVELRRHAPTDRAALVDAVNRSLAELRPWMPWAQVPATDQSIGEFLARAGQAWDEGIEFLYAMWPAGDAGGSDGVIGACGLHLRSEPGVVEIGYWVRSDRTGAGVATAAARVLSRAALDLSEIVRIEIHCDGANAASRAVATKLGFRLDRIDLRPPLPRTPGETDQLMIWVHPG
jgi:RimJ/RimL family protein N-acetyltransferase